jgi:EpsD family peptidyl-prolyl cis-trans isomerase
VHRNGVPTGRDRNRRRLPAALAALVLLVTGCGGGNSSERASQTAARVNRTEITVHQINHVLQQQRGLRPEQAETLAQQVLERLIDQELAVERANDLDLDRDPKVLMRLDAARRAILARAYLERVGEAASRPTADEVRRYFDEHPARFRDRRLYELKELAIEATPEQIPALRARLASTSDLGEYVRWLRASGYRFSSHEALRTADQLPPDSLRVVAALREGQAQFNAVSDGARILVVGRSTAQPMSLDQAASEIERILLGERQRQLVQVDIRALRAKATVEYVGRFAESAPPVAASAASGVGLELVNEAGK